MSNFARSEAALAASQEVATIYWCVIETSTGHLPSPSPDEPRCARADMASAGHTRKQRLPHSSIAPPVERQPQAVGDLEHPLCHDYLASCERRAPTGRRDLGSPPQSRTTGMGFSPTAMRSATAFGMAISRRSSSTRRARATRRRGARILFGGERSQAPVLLAGGTASSSP
jgi:hypothetical protein